MYINKAFIFGNLTRDPETRALPNGTTVVTFSVATNRTFKDAAGMKKEATDYHNVVSFGKQAEVIGRYLRKGSSVFIEGRIQTRSWDGKDGTKQYRTEIVVDGFQFGPRPAGAGFEGGAAPAGRPLSASAAPSFASQAPAASAEELATIEYPADDVDPNDIPF